MLNFLFFFKKKRTREETLAVEAEAAALLA
jgi:hypothetical protein